jgi:hypothetical protein
LRPRSAKTRSCEDQSGLQAFVSTGSIEDPSGSET